MGPELEQYAAPSHSLSTPQFTLLPASVPSESKEGGARQRGGGGLGVAFDNPKLELP